MERRSFLYGVGAGGAVYLFPPTASAADKAKTEAKVVRAAEAKVVWAMGVRVTIRADAKLTGGAYSVFEDLVPSGQGPPLHTHSKEDETMYVIEGELEVVLGDRVYTAKPGDFAHMARGVPHRFKNLTEKPARMLLSYTPGGFEQWFLDVGTPVTDPAAKPPAITPADIEKAIKVAEAYGVTFARKK